MTRAALLLVLLAASASADVDPAAVFKTNCAACHGADGKGKSPMGKTLHVKDLASDDVQAQSDADLRKIIIDGKGKMPAYKGKLTDDEVGALVSFIRSVRR
jgi:cytochrome c6